MVRLGSDLQGLVTPLVRRTRERSTPTDRVHTGTLRRSDGQPASGCFGVEVNDVVVREAHDELAGLQPGNPGAVLQGQRLHVDHLRFRERGHVAGAVDAGEVAALGADGECSARAGGGRAARLAPRRSGRRAGAAIRSGRARARVRTRPGPSATAHPHRSCQPTRHRPGTRAAAWHGADGTCGPCRTRACRCPGSPPPGATGCPAGHGRTEARPRRPDGHDGQRACRAVPSPMTTR